MRSSAVLPLILSTLATLSTAAPVTPTNFGSIVGNGDNSLNNVGNLAGSGNANNNLNGNGVGAGSNVSP